MIDFDSMSLHVDALSSRQKQPTGNLVEAHAVFGCFDGVHRGHRSLIQQAKRIAMLDGAPLVAINLEPVERLDGGAADSVVRLTDQEEMAELLREVGADKVICLPIEPSDAQSHGQPTIAQALTQAFRPRSVTVCDSLSSSASGRSALQVISDICRVGEIPLQQASLVSATSDPQAISSRAIRGLLADGRITEANEMLGRRWTMRGRVVHGDKRGALLGFPTANIAPLHRNRYRQGIYTMRILVKSKVWDAVGCYGTRPQFDDGAPRLEIYILDFSGDIYGEMALFEFVAFQRSEKSFSDVDALIKQMNLDCSVAREILADAARNPSIDSVLPRRAKATGHPVSGRSPVFFA